MKARKRALGSQRLVGNVRKPEIYCGQGGAARAGGVTTADVFLLPSELPPLQRVREGREVAARGKKRGRECPPFEK